MIKRDFLKHQIQALTTKYEAKKAQLQENETHVQLGALEQKLKAQESLNYGLKEFIASKTAESNYIPIAKEVESLTDAVNGQLIKMISSPRRQ